MKKNTIETYTTPNGLKLLTEWNDQNRITACQGIAKLFDCVRFAAWGDRPKTRGQMAMRMPYTSSSAFAAMWAGVAFGAVDKKNSNKKLAGVAVSDQGEAVAFWKLCDDNGNEIEDIFEVIK